MSLPPNFSSTPASAEVSKTENTISDSPEHILIWISLGVVTAALIAITVLLSGAGLDFKDPAVLAPLVFAFISVALYFFGVRKALRSLNSYDNESQDLQDLGQPLRGCAAAAEPEGPPGSPLSPGG